MKLKQAFDVTPGDVVAFIGAGGKTSLMVGLGYELAEAGWRVLATTTTKLSQEQVALFPWAMPYDAAPKTISNALSQHQLVLLHDEIRSGRVYGPAVEWTRSLLDSVDSDILLVEADDAAGLSFKAPLADEPLIPLETTLVVSVASLSALGVPLDTEHVYNPAAMIERYGFAENSPVKSPWLAQVLRDEELGLRGVPTDARVIIYLNQTPEQGYVRGRARLIARLSLQSKRISAVALGSVRGATPVSELQRPVAALVLAASDSWGVNSNTSSTTVSSSAAVAKVAEQLMRSRIDNIRIVTGHCASEIRKAVKHLGIKTAHNRGFQSGGLVSACRTGLRALPDHITAFLLVPGDHAAIQPKVIYQILSAYARGEGEIIIPRFRKCCGNPVLISRRYLSEIIKMPRDTGWSHILESFASQITYINVDTDCILPLAGVVPDHHLLRIGAAMRSRSR